MKAPLHQTLDHLFRHEYGKIVAGLTARFGSGHIEQIEDAVQEALLKAMKVWAFNEIPQNPTAWLFRVAGNKMIDVLRRDNKLEALPSGIEAYTNIKEPVVEMEIEDEQLKMIFACCNPALNERESLLLSLKLIGGFSISEIGRALLIKEEAAKKSIQRAKSKFRMEVKGLYIPHGEEMKLYLSRVTTVVYLIFNEGYKSSVGEELIRKDFCGEALRLALILSRNKYASHPSVFSLISLISFKISRFNARLVDGKLVTLENQNRSLWIKDYAQWAFYYYNQATKNRDTSVLYIEASIEFQYHIAKRFEETDWLKILELYDHLIRRKSSPILELNRLIVFARLNPPKTVLKALDVLKTDLEEHYLYYAFKAELFQKLNDPEASLKNFETALHLTQNRVEQVYLKERIKMLTSL